MKRVSSEKLRRAIKTKGRISSERPDFNRSEYTRFPRLGNKWRSSKGIRSKMRLKKRSRAAIVETGYRSPIIARNLRVDGRSEVLIFRTMDLASLDPATQVARIGGDVGRRKRLEILEKAAELNVTVVNRRPSDKPLKPKEEEEAEKKRAKKEKKEEEKKLLEEEEEPEEELEEKTEAAPEEEAPKEEGE